MDNILQKCEQIVILVFQIFESLLVEFDVVLF